MLSSDPKGQISRKINEGDDKKKTFDLFEKR